MDNRLFSLKKTLNEIEVHGSENLDRLLGCIQTVDRMIREETEHEQDPIE
ncbi:MAG: hypothetical protein IJ214_12395 [Clostridia bacterium]|nr:hypothetical protein [Clostridia bacterium]